MSIDTIALIATLALGFLGIWYQLRTGQKELRDDIRADLRGLRDDNRTEMRGLRDEMCGLRDETRGLRDEMRVGFAELRDEMREQHKEVMALLLNMDKSLAVLADRTPRESYPPPRKARS